MRVFAVSAGAAVLFATVAWAGADDCKFCATEIVVRATQADCLRQKLDQAARDIGDRKTVLIDLLTCGRPGDSPSQQTQSSPSAPPPIAGAPQNAPAQVYRLTRAGLECVQKRLTNVPPGQDPIRLSTICT